ncbi:MAG: uroporphyrinogen decarboxylase family protein [Planctomycetota bacterium]|jgi:hypothetical protein
MRQMTSLRRMTAAIRGEPFDRYPFINPYPMWSMMPHWPELTGLTWAHVNWGSDEQRLRCWRALHDKIGLDWMPISWGPCGQDARFRIETEAGAVVLIDTVEGRRTRFDEFPKDLPPKAPRSAAAGQVEALPAPPTAEDILAGDNVEMVRKAVAEFGDSVFLFAGAEGPYSACFRALGFEGVYEAVLDNPRIIHAISQRHVEHVAQHARASAKLGAHGLRINEYPAGAELLSDEHYRELIFPYERRIIRAIRDAGLVAILEYLGWVGPRLEHFARLDINCLQTESSLKNYRNDVGEMRKALGENVCLFSNSPIRDVIELGDAETWRRDAAEQARGIGKQRRFAICAGSPTTWATGPQRLRRYGEFMRKALAEIAPPLG